MQNNNQKLLIVDGSSLLATGFYATAKDVLFAKNEEQKEIALKKIMKSMNGTYTNGIYMFFKTLLPILNNYGITHLAVVLDKNRETTFRKEIYPEYKENRKETPEPLKKQFKLLNDILIEMNIPTFSNEKYEADDYAGSLVNKFEKDIQIYCYSKDEDYIQLVSEYTKLWIPTSKCDDMYRQVNAEKNIKEVPNGIFEYTPEYVKILKGIEPIQIIDIKAIEGDKSDNIPGIRGLGPMASKPLINHYNSVEEIYKNIEGLNDEQEIELNKFFKDELGIKRSPLKNLKEYKESALMSKVLATIKTDINEIENVTLDMLKLNINLEKKIEIFNMLNIKSLL